MLAPVAGAGFEECFLFRRLFVRRSPKCFLQHPPIHWQWRFQTEEMQNRGCEIDITAWGLIVPPAPKIRPARDTGIAQVERTKGRVCALAQIFPEIGGDFA